MYVCGSGGWSKVSPAAEGAAGHRSQDDKRLKTLTFLPEKDEVIPCPYIAGKHLSCVLKSHVLRD